MELVLLLQLFWFVKTPVPSYHERFLYKILFQQEDVVSFSIDFQFHHE